MHIGKHRKGDPEITDQDRDYYARDIKALPTYAPETCQHRSVALLAGRKVCNDGCGKDMGPE